ncbi:MAG: D-alanine--D-alanine ligase [Maricaulaceae bacterium]
MSGRRIAVLMGGLSAEREVSLKSGRACADALTRQGWDVVEIDAGRALWTQLEAAQPDVVFNALHGEWGEDGRVQGVLDLFGKPYTHSGVLASALAMDKQRAKGVFAQAGLCVPEGFIARREDAARDHLMAPPYVVKPNAQGSSVGVFVVREGDHRPPAALLEAGWGFGEYVLVEAYAPGREFTVAVLGERPLAVTEIVPPTAFYDYEAKYAAGGSAHILPAEIPEAAADAMKAAALTAHQALGCRGLTRTDFRWAGGNDPARLLEINTQPGMTTTSLAPEQAGLAGMDFDALVEWIARDATWPR